MPFKGRDGGTWKDASAVYGKSGGSWLYGKSAWAKKNDVWERAWTDCRLYDAGGRDWSAPTTVVTYNGSCGNRTQTTTVTRTKTGCPNDVRSTTVASPDCNSGCFTASAVNCDGCGSATYYTANAGSGCTSYQVGSCGTWVAQTGDLDFTPSGGKYYFYTETPGYYNVAFDNCNPSCGFPQANIGSYYITRCSVTGEYRISLLSCTCS